MIAVRILLRLGNRIKDSAGVFLHQPAGEEHFNGVKDSEKVHTLFTSTKLLM
jgi:hypothetical protein